KSRIGHPVREADHLRRYPRYFMDDDDGGTGAADIDGLRHAFMGKTRRFVPVEHEYLPWSRLFIEREAAAKRQTKTPPGRSRAGFSRKLACFSEAWPQVRRSTSRSALRPDRHRPSRR